MGGQWQGRSFSIFGRDKSDLFSKDSPSTYPPYTDSYRTRAEEKSTNTGPGRLLIRMLIPFTLIVVTFKPADLPPTNPVIFPRLIRSGKERLLV